jgi:hypothetical protein
VVCVRLLYVCVVLVFTIGVHGPAIFVADSQRIIAPVWPDKVNVPVLVVPQTCDVGGLTVPPTEAAATVNRAGLLVASGGHVPVTIQR